MAGSARDVTAMRPMLCSASLLMHSSCVRAMDDMHPASVSPTRRTRDQGPVVAAPKDPGSAQVELGPGHLAVAVMAEAPVAGEPSDDGQATAADVLEPSR